MEQLRVLSNLWRCVLWKTELPGINKACMSPEFSLDGCLWQLKLVGFWIPIEGQGWNVFLRQNPGSDTERLSMYLVNNNGELQLVYSGESVPREEFHGIFSLNGNGITGDNITMLLSCDLNSRQLKDISAACSVTDSKEIPEMLSNYPSLSSLSEDMEKLFNKEDSDAVLRCGDRSLFVNKMILSARSDVFAAMFRNKMSENETGVVDIEDMESSVLEQFIRYIYSGKVEELSMDSVFDLYRAGEKYAIPSLKVKCASFMVDNFSEENICEVLLLAYMFNDSELLDKAIHFAVHTTGFLKSTKWIHFARENTALAVEVFTKYHTK